MAKWKKTRICIKYVLNMLWSEQCEIIATIPPSPPPIKTLMFVPKKASRSILKHTHILQWDTMILFSFYYFMFSLKIFLNWSTVVIQCCLSFCCTTTWINDRYRTPPYWTAVPPCIPSQTCPLSQNMGSMCHKAPSRWPAALLMVVGVF